VQQAKANELIHGILERTTGIADALVNPGRDIVFERERRTWHTLMIRYKHHDVKLAVVY
jgi:hypothetical protein